jgi:hypothetical protein
MMLTSKQKETLQSFHYYRKWKSKGKKEIGYIDELTAIMMLTLKQKETLQTGVGT